MRVALTRGLSRKQIATDFGVGFSTLNRWIKEERDQIQNSEPQIDLIQANERLRKGVRMLREEREILKGNTVLREAKAMRFRFRFIEEHCGKLSIQRLCEIMNVSARGYTAYRTRPMSKRQRTNIVLLAHIREQFKQSHCTYGRPRMVEELKDLGLQFRHRRVGRLMRQNEISVVRTRKYKVTTDSNHKFNIAPNLLNRNFVADRPNQKWVVDISHIWAREGWLHLAAILDLHSRHVIG